MARCLLALGVCLGLLGCGAELGVRSQPITNGEEDPDHPAVNKLIFALSGGDKQDGACTATLVGQKTALTAAHCAGYGLTSLVVQGANHDSAANVVHPDYDPNVSAYLNDLALVRLETAPPVAPVRIVTGPPVPGASITLVGFGKTSQSATDQGVKRLAKNSIDELKPYYFTFSGASDGEGNACYGDSGGPVLITVDGAEHVLGVMSYITGDCGSSTTIATRLDTFLSWLQTASEGDVEFYDTVKPTVKIDAPSDGTAVFGPLGVQVSATDDLGVTSVELFSDGASLGELSAAPYVFTGVALASGPHQLEALATDAAGNQGRSAPVTVTVLLPDGGPLVDLTPGRSDAGPSPAEVGPAAEGGRHISDGCGFAPQAPATGLWPLLLVLLFADLLRPGRRGS